MPTPSLPDDLARFVVGNADPLVPTWSTSKTSRPWKTSKWMTGCLDLQGDTFKF